MNREGCEGKEELRSTERRSSSIIPAETDPCPAGRRWFFCARRETRLSFNLAKLSAVLCKKPNVISLLCILSCAMKAEEIRGWSDLIPLLLGPAKVWAVWISHVCVCWRSVVLGKCCVLWDLHSLLLVLPILMQQSTYPVVSHHINMKPSRGGSCKDLCVLPVGNKVPARHCGTCSRAWGRTVPASACSVCSGSSKGRSSWLPCSTNLCLDIGRPCTASHS